MHRFVNILLLLLMVSDGFCWPTERWNPFGQPEHNSKQQKMDNKPFASSTSELGTSSEAIAKVALKDHYKNKNYKIENIKVDHKVQGKSKTSYDMTLTVKDNNYIAGRDMHVIGRKNRATGNVEKVSWGWL